MDGEVLVRTFDAPHEAELSAGYLRANGIKARIDNDVLQGMNPLLSPVLGGVRVYVPKRNLESALELLEEAAVKPAPREEHEADRIAGRAAASAVLGYTLLPFVGQLYSLWLLSKVRTSELTPRGRRHHRLALALDLGLAVLLGYVFLSA